VSGNDENTPEKVAESDGRRWINPITWGGERVTWKEDPAPPLSDAQRQQLLEMLFRRQYESD
jgi:hypothetical protein